MDEGLSLTLKTLEKKGQNLDIHNVMEILPSTIRMTCSFILSSIEKNKKKIIHLNIYVVKLYKTHGSKSTLSALSKVGMKRQEIHTLKQQNTSFKRP